MPQSLADARGGARLALVRELPAAARSVSVRASVPNGAWAGPTLVAAAASAAGDAPSVAMDGAARTGLRGRVAGAVVLVTLLGTVLLSALAASATLAWAGH